MSRHSPRRGERGICPLGLPSRVIPILVPPEQYDHEFRLLESEFLRVCEELAGPDGWKVPLA